MANLMKREGGLPLLWICFAIYMSVVLAHAAPLELSVGDSEERSLSNLDPLFFTSGGKGAGVYERKVVDVWTNDAVRDLKQLNKNLEQKMADMQSKLTQSENELVTAKSKWTEEKWNLRSSFKEEELLLKAELGKVRDQYKADLASCQSRQQDMMTVEACDSKTHKALSECEKERDKCAAGLEDNIEVRGSSRDMETRPSSCFENVSREKELGKCRLENADAQAKLAKLANQPKGQDAETVKTLKVLVAAVVTISLGLVAALVVCWISLVKGGNERSSLSTQPQVLSSEEARTMLVSMFETEGKVSSILTSPVASGSEGYMFLLVPVNLNASRSLTLFGGGGCYTRQVEVACESARNERKILVLVLYRYGGHAFTLRDMKMPAEALLSKATPRDQDFPQERDILVLWTRGLDDLQVTQSGDNSELSEIVRRQPWARHLGRSS